ncbi:MAG: hypothetical protein ACKO3R_10905 [bacterium]
MADVSSVNFNNPPVDFPPNTPKSTGDRVAENNLANIGRQQASDNQVKTLQNVDSRDDNRAAINELHDSTLASGLEMESKAGNTVSPQDLNQASTSQDLINKSHLEALKTAASAVNNAPEKMGAFKATASMPWASLESEIKPQYDSAMGQRNPFVEAVRENPIAKIAALTFIPTTLPALWALMGGQTSADKALAVVSLAQNEFVINGIKDDGSIRDFSTRVRERLDFLNGIKLESIKAESDPSLKFAGLLLEQVMKAEEKPNALQETVTERHIIGARESLNELNAFLTKNPEDIISGVKENGGPFALKAMIEAVTGVPALLEAKYHAGPQVDSLIKAMGITEKAAVKHRETLDGVGGFFNKILGRQVEKAEKIVTQAAKDSEVLSRKAAEQIMTGFAQTLNDPQTRQGIHDASHHLTNLGTQLFKTVADTANQGLTSNLASVNDAIARASKANSN